MGDILNSIFYSSSISGSTFTTTELLLEFSGEGVVNASLMISGDATLVADWNTFFGGSYFSSVETAGNYVNLKGASGLNIPASLFSNNVYAGTLIKVLDYAGCVTVLSDGVFGDANDTYWCTDLEECYFPAVTQIGLDCFRSCGSLWSAITPSALEIGSFCFYGTTSLKVTDFSSVLGFDSSCFENSGIHTIYAPSATEILDNCFLGSEIEDVYFPLLISASASAFQDCIHLRNIYFPKLSTIGSSCFEGCSSLSSIVDFPSLSLTGSLAFSSSSIAYGIFPVLYSIGNSAFAYCTSLEKLYMPSLRELGSTVGDNSVFSSITSNTIELTLNSDDYLLTCNSGNPDGDLSALIAENLVYINGIVYPPSKLVLSFSNIADADVIVGGDATLLANWNSYFTSTFTNIEVVGNSVNLWGGTSFASTASFGVTSAAPSLLGIIDGGSYINWLQYGFGVLDSESHIGCLNLKTCYLPNSDVEVLKGQMFKGCRHLEYVYMPHVIETDNDNAMNYPFSGLPLESHINIVVDGSSTVLTSVDFDWLRVNTEARINGVVLWHGNKEVMMLFNDISNAATMIGDTVSDVAHWNTFFNSPTGTPFTSVEVLGNIVNLKGGSNLTLREELFVGNTCLYCFVDWRGAFIVVEDEVFYLSTILASCVLPNVTSVGAYAFGDVSSITDIFLPSVTSIGTYAFSSNMILRHLEISKVTSVGDYCFYDCANLQLLNMPVLETLGSTAVGDVDDGVFYYCSHLNEIIVPIALSTVNNSNPDYDLYLVNDAYGTTITYV